MLRRLVVVLMLAAGGLAIAPSSALADAPAVGQCHELAPAVLVALSDSSAPVPCSGLHNALTVAVVQSQAPLAQLPENAVALLGARACYPAYWQALGGTPQQQGLSDFAMILFAPSAEERAAGESWFRCDAVLMNGRSVAALPALGTPPLPQPLPASLQRCLNRAHMSLPCARPHAYRAFKVFRLSGQPGSAKAISAQASRHCRGVASVTWDSGPGWSLGDHWATCFRRTTR